MHIDRWKLTRVTHALPIILIFSCSAGAPQATRKVMLIGLDGVRPDILMEVNTPNMDSLASHGTYTWRARTGYPSVSGPGWSSYLTGVWPAKHGVTNNEFEGKNYTQYPDIFTRLESIDPEFETFVTANWLPLVAEDHNGPVISDQVDTKLAFDGYEGGWLETDLQSVRAAEDALANGNPDAMFVYLGNPDETSHHFQSIGAEYRQAIETADEHVGRLVHAVQRRPTFADEDWLILISTDHGRTPDGDHGGDTDEERTIFYIASGPSAIQGMAPDTTFIVDLPVTALHHLGIEIDPAWGLDGRVVGLQTR